MKQVLREVFSIVSGVAGVLVVMLGLAWMTRNPVVGFPLFILGTGLLAYHLTR